MRALRLAIILFALLHVVAVLVWAEWLFFHGRAQVHVLLYGFVVMCVADWVLFRLLWATFPRRRDDADAPPPEGGAVSWSSVSSVSRSRPGRGRGWIEYNTEDSLTEGG